jgi:hypothetical protein
VSAGYINRSGAKITAKEWEALIASESYSTVRRYDNSEVRVVVDWVGTVANMDVFPEMRKVIRLDIFNLNSSGKWVKDPVQSDLWFPNEETAINAYEQFIERWTNSHRDENDELIEEDNLYAPPPPPPPPPSPDAPASDCASIKGVVDDGVGAW